MTTMTHFSVVNKSIFIFSLNLKRYEMELMTRKLVRRQRKLSGRVTQASQRAGAALV